MATQRLSDERLAEIRERADKATKGPWEFSDGKSKRCDAFNRNYLRGGDSAIVIDAVDISYDYTDSENFLVIEPEDQAFIAHARQDIPDLLAEIERLRGELAARPVLQGRSKGDAIRIGTTESLIPREKN